MKTISKTKKIIKNDSVKVDKSAFAQKYSENGFIPFTINIQHNSGKKLLKNVPSFSTINSENYVNFIDDSMNGMAIRLGCESDNYYIVLIDIDNKEDNDSVLNGITKWNELIKKKKINTPTQKTGNDGLHYLFKVSEEDFKKLPASITELSIEGQKYSIDFKGKNQFVIVEPSKYDDKYYKWTTDYTTNIQILPKWIHDILLNNKPIKAAKSKKLPKDEVPVGINEDVIISAHKKEDDELSDNEKKYNYAYDDIEYLLSLLSSERSDNYDEWIKVGMCLYNIDKKNLILWQKWSKRNKKYKQGECEQKWKTFLKNKDTGLKIGSLLLWCRNDNPIEYKKYMRGLKTNNIVITKFPKENLQLGESKLVNKNYSYINLNNDDCLIYGDNHGEPTMYVEMIKDLMTIRCKHSGCFGKIYPCEHIQLSKNEMNIIFNGDLHVTINNDANLADVDEFKKINLFETIKLNELAYEGLNGKPIPYAKIMYELYKNDYMYAENDEWYIFENHHWNLLVGYNTDLRESINEKLKSIYTKIKEYYIEQEGKSSKTVRAIKQLIANFDSTQLTDDIMKELKYVYLGKNNKGRDFLKKIDANPYLIGFTNGVYDLKNHKFRDGKQEDYISMTTQYDYRDKYSIHYKRLITFLEDIQPNFNEREYLITYIATALLGNTLELFTVLVGEGRNGKSKFVDLLEKVFGDYCDRIGSQILTSQMKEGDAPAPALLSLANKKIVIASETLDNAKLNTGFIKFLTGCDTKKDRYCHRNDMVKFSPNFITMLVCNDIPECDKIDNAFIKRLRCINFPIEFVDENPQKHNQKLKDKMIKMYFDDWKQDFFLLLLEHYKRYEIDNQIMRPTDNILKLTNQYRENTDVVLNFLEECTQECKSNIISTSQLYEKFKKWYAQNNPNRTIPCNRIFTSNIKKHKVVERARITKTSNPVNVIKGLKLCDEN